MIPPGCRACHCPKCMEALQYSFRNVGDVAQSSSNYAIPKMHASGFRTPEYHRAYRVWAITNLGYGPYNIILHTVHIVQELKYWHATTMQLPVLVLRQDQLWCVYP